MFAGGFYSVPYGVVVSFWASRYWILAFLFWVCSEEVMAFEDDKTLLVWRWVSDFVGFGVWVFGFP